MHPAKLLEIYKRKMISHGGQIDKATNLVKVYYTTLKKDRTAKSIKIHVSRLNNKIFEQTL